MRIKNFSWVSFFIGGVCGVLLGALMLGLVVNYLIQKAISNDPATGVFLGQAVEQVREGFAIVGAEKQATKVYGNVVSIGNGILVLRVQRNQGQVDYTFTFTDQTKIVSLAQDAVSTEIPLSSDAIEIGAGLNVFTNEPVGSVENQHAVKIIQI